MNSIEIVLSIYLGLKKLVVEFRGETPTEIEAEFGAAGICRRFGLAGLALRGFRVSLKFASHEIRGLA